MRCSYSVLKEGRKRQDKANVALGTRQSAWVSSTRIRMFPSLRLFHSFSWDGHKMSSLFRFKLIVTKPEPHSLALTTWVSLSMITFPFYHNPYNLTSLSVKWKRKTKWRFLPVLRSSTCSTIVGSPLDHQHQNDLGCIWTEKARFGPRPRSADPWRQRGCTSHRALTQCFCTLKKVSPYSQPCSPPRVCNKPLAGRKKGCLTQTVEETNLKTN